MLVLNMVNTFCGVCSAARAIGEYGIYFFKLFNVLRCRFWHLLLLFLTLHSNFPVFFQQIARQLDREYSLSGHLGL
jgi:hypothetical protein